MQREYDALNVKAAKQKDLERGRENKADQQRLIEEGRAYDELQKKVAALLDATQILLHGEMDAQDQKIKKIEDEIRAWQDLAAEQGRIHPGIKTFAIAAEWVRMKSPGCATGTAAVSATAVRAVGTDSFGP